MKIQSIAPHRASRRPSRASDGGSIDPSSRARTVRSFAMSNDDDAETQDVDEEFLALVRRARAVAAVAAADVADAERLSEAEDKWGQAITRDGRKYYYDKENRATVQWERPRALKGTRRVVARAYETHKPTLPAPWRELPSETEGKIPYYWNVETGEVRWERPRCVGAVDAVVAS